MTTLTIRNVPEDVRDELAARAARAGSSMQEYVLRTLVDIAYTPSQAEVLVEIRRRARTFPPEAADAILDDLAADRR